MNDATLTRLHSATLAYARTRWTPDPMVDAEDLASMAWLKAHGHLSDAFTEAEHRGYLRSAVSCCATDVQRAWRRRPTLPLVGDHPGPERFEDAVLDGLTLAPYLLAAATDPYLLAVLLLALGYDQREAGARMGCAAGTVSTRVWRYRRAHGGLQT